MEKARQAHTHQARQIILSELLQKVFGVKLIEILPGIEKKVGSKVLGVRGSIDLLFRNVIFEVKVDLDRELEDAKRELKKYFQALYEENPEERCVGIATDVIKYRAYLPIIKDGLVVDVEEISSIDISKVSYSEAISWLDAYIFSKPKIRPTAEDLKHKFGLQSPTYKVVVHDGLRKLWDEVKNDESVKLKLDLWSKSMEIVYGSKPDTSTFIDHTYLVTLVKLIVYLRLSGEHVITEEKIREALTGEYFTSYGISNLIEEDFFSWILHEKIADRTLKLFTGVARELLIYDYSQIDEDFFKEIYQEIVERGQRRRIGEYYTPEWLAELTLSEALNMWWEKNKEPPRILDPACGSGTFLTNAIRMLKDRLLKSGWEETRVLDYLLDDIVGIDVNPLAVVIARANYLIALGDLLHHRKGSINIPVYVADSIKIPMVTPKGLYGVECYDWSFNNIIHLSVPASIAKGRGKFWTVINVLKDAVDYYRRNRGISLKEREAARKMIVDKFEEKLSKGLESGELKVLVVTLQTILNYIDKGLDSIWVYMLSNIYAPAILKEQKFDIIVGNPPWIAMNSIENKEYQDFIKQQVLSYQLLDRTQVNLFSNMEVATLFFCKSSDIYLKEGGVIAFVMPRSVLTGALHHANFKRFKKPKMKLVKILDLEDVSPLFNVPSCVLIAVKGGETRYPVLARRYMGKLPGKNIKLSEAVKHIKVEDYMYEPPRVSVEYSWYHDRIRNGATIYPRNFWFVEFLEHPVLGIDVSRPLVKTSTDALKNPKDRWRGVELKGNVESVFIYATLLSGDLVPFGYYELKPVVLPLDESSNSYKMLDVNELRSRGFTLMAEWLEKAQKIWEERASRRSLKNFPRVIYRLNFMGNLTSQNPRKRYVVLFNAGGANPASCVIDRKSLPAFRVAKAEIMPRGFVAENSTYFYETDDEIEAHYLSAILNSSIINNMIKPLQPKGAFGERGVHRRPFMFPIPKFDGNNPIHLRLAELSKMCHRKVASLKFTKKKTAGRREEARRAVENELAEIDKLVSRILST